VLLNEREARARAIGMEGDDIHGSAFMLGHS